MNKSILVLVFILSFSLVSSITYSDDTYGKITKPSSTITSNNTYINQTIINGSTYNDTWINSTFLKLNQSTQQEVTNTPLFNNIDIKGTLIRFLDTIFMRASDGKSMHFEAGDGIGSEEGGTIYFTAGDGDHGDGGLQVPRGVQQGEG